MPYIVLDIYREKPTYNDIFGKIYHFPRKYLPYFSKLPIDFVYFEPAKRGNGTYLGYGKIREEVKEDKLNKGLFFAIIDDFKEFYSEVHGSLETNSNYYNPRNAVRRIERSIFRRICENGFEEIKDETASINFDPYIFRLLGDQLISRNELAVFELVKNAYDADATNVKISIDILSEKPSITVTDDGLGMTKEIIKEGWLTIGGSNKRGDARFPSPVFKRMPLGEKGVGRLAAFKLGNKVSLVTRAKGQPEYHVDLDLESMKLETINKDGLKAKIETRKEEDLRFAEDTTGTEIRISNLRNKKWERRDVRALKRTVGSLRSPFNTPDSFNVEMAVPGNEDWLESLYSLDDILGHASWKFDFTLSSEGEFSWDYQFLPPLNLGLEPVSFSEGSGRLPMIPELLGESAYPKKRLDAVLLDSSQLKGIGRINGKFYVFHRRREILGGSKELFEYLRGQTGIRVYRDGVRVYDYGEPGNDWLGLDAYRINRPAERLANNTIIGLVELDLKESTELNEKTNREGFDHNDTFIRFRRTLLSVVAFLDRKRRIHRIALQSAISGKDVATLTNAHSFENAISELESFLREKKLLEDMTQRLETINREYFKLKKIMMEAGMAGLNLSLIFHEVERNILGLSTAIKRGENKELLTSRIDMTVRLLDGFADLFKKNGRKPVSVKRLFQRIFEINEGRFRYHQVDLTCPFIEGEEMDFKIKCAFGLCLGALNNLIDNSLYWTRFEKEKNSSSQNPAIFLSALPPKGNVGPSILVADNGTGFSIDPEEACLPFVTEKPGGMGLGLYYAKLVAETHGGKLLIGMPADYDLPDRFKNGAVVVLEFKEGDDIS